MDITPRLSEGLQVINAYGAGGFKVAGKNYAGGIIVLPLATLAWQALSIKDITFASLQPVAEYAGKIELLLVGTGTSFTLLDPALKASLKEKSIALEAMDTAAACRTFNVLLAEERRVAAALLPV